MRKQLICFQCDTIKYYMLVCLISLWLAASWLLFKHLEGLQLWLLPGSSAVEFIPRRACPAVLFVSAFCSKKGKNGRRGGKVRVRERVIEWWEKNRWWTGRLRQRDGVQEERGKTPFRVFFLFYFLQGNLTLSNSAHHGKYHFTPPAAPFPGQRQASS